LDDLLEIAIDIGLAAHLGAVRELARYSMRLTVLPATNGRRRPQVSGRAQRPDGVLLGLTLSEMSSSIPIFSPPLRGTLVFVQDTPRSCTVVLDDGEDNSPNAAWGAAGDSSLSIGMSAELVLPRVWSEPVQALELDQAGQTAWIALRERLAALQEVALHSEDPDPSVIHRLLGYPDERTGDMALACELLACGIDLDGVPPFAHPRAAELGPRSTRWRMLLQLSADDLVGWNWGSQDARLYVWIDTADLAAGEFSRTRAIVR